VVEPLGYGGRRGDGAQLIGTYGYVDAGAAALLVREVLVAGTQALAVHVLGERLDLELRLVLDRVAEINERLARRQAFQAVGELGDALVVYDVSVLVAESQSISGMVVRVSEGVATLSRHFPSSSLVVQVTNGSLTFT
jgi:hypothetical protein